MSGPEEESLVLVYGRWAGRDVSVLLPMIICRDADVFMQWVGTLGTPIDTGETDGSSEPSAKMSIRRTVDLG